MCQPAKRMGPEQPRSAQPGQAGQILPSVAAATPAIPDSMTLHYSLTLPDLMGWQLYQLSRNKLLWACYFLWVLFIAHGILTLPSMAAAPILGKSILVLFAAGIIALLFALVMTLIVFLTLVFRSNRGLIGKHELVINEAGVREKTEFNDSLFRWSGFHKLISTTHYFYLYVNEGSVHVVPKRSFASEQACDSFEKVILKYFPRSSLNPFEKRG